MTISVYEFAQYDTFSGLPVHPPSKVTLAQALPASVTLASTTRIVQVLANADVRLTTDNSTPGQTDYFLANKGVSTIRVLHPATNIIRAVASI